MKHYRFGQYADWLRGDDKDTEPWYAFLKLLMPKRPVICFVYEDDILLAAVDCTEWTWTSVPGANYKETLKQHIQAELNRTIIKE
mgnify:CR=1 FL=1